MRTILILRGVIAVLVFCLGVAALASGRTVIGVLLVAFAVTNATLVVVLARRRAEMQRRFSSGDRPGS